nr:hypothetical protein [Staphylococcus agnetis]
MRENFKLRKKKVGLVSVVIAAMYITMQGHAEASENSDEVSQPKKTVFQHTEVIETKQTDTKENVQENYIKLDKVTPGDTTITGKTLPNQSVSLTIDDKISVQLKAETVDLLNQIRRDFSNLI